MKRILFVCMGNICRSPTAEGVFRRLAAEAGLLDSLHVDSAGTHGYHVGRPPDSRASATAAGRGYDLSALRARQVTREDFETFDYILAMDRENYDHLAQLAPKARRDRLHLFLEYSTRFPGQEVPDPYYGGAQGFEQVLDMVEDAARGLIAELGAHAGRSVRTT